MKSNALLGEIGLGFLVLVGAVASACSAADTVSVAPHPAAGGSSGGASSGTAGAPTGSGGGGSSVTSGSGGVSTGVGGDANPATGGGAGDAIDMTPDAAAPSEGGADVASEASAPISCPNATMCLKTYLVHRYSFTGTGATATDTAGTANGTVVNATLSGSGDVALAAGAYVDLPNGIVKQLTSATFETWVTWSGGATGWQRLFDFGSSDGAEGAQGSAATTLYLTPQAGGPTVMLAGFKRAEQTFDMEARAASTLPLATGVKTHIAVVVDPAHTLMTLYRNGMPDGSVLCTTTLSMLNDINNWLGRSQYGGDPAFTGTLTEFRIYSAALPPDVVQASFTAGEDATF